MQYERENQYIHKLIMSSYKNLNYFELLISDEV